MHKKNIFLSLFFIFLLSISISSSYARAEDEDDDGEDNAKDLGEIAFALFAVACIYIAVYQIFILSRKLPKDNERAEQIKKKIGDFHKLVKKPLSLLHYGAASAAIIFLWIHGSALIGEDNSMAAIGLTTASLLTFFVLSGLIIKLTHGKGKVAITLKKVLYKIHTNLIIFLVVLIPHLIHISMED